MPPFILNGELGEGVVSSDDVNHPNGGPGQYRGWMHKILFVETFEMFPLFVSLLKRLFHLPDQPGLHRTSSEPYNNFEHLELENRLADPMFLLEQQRQMEGRGGTIGGTLPRLVSTMMTLDLCSLLVFCS